MTGRRAVFRWTNKMARHVLSARLLMLGPRSVQATVVPAGCGAGSQRSGLPLVLTQKFEVLDAAPLGSDSQTPPLDGTGSQTTAAPSDHRPLHFMQWCASTKFSQPAEA